MNREFLTQDAHITGLGSNPFVELGHVIKSLALLVCSHAVGNSTEPAMIMPYARPIQATAELCLPQTSTGHSSETRTSRVGFCFDTF